jgi:hypothetical protein
MASTSAQKGKTLYVMETEGHYWLSSLATNRQECWAHAMKYCRTDNPKKELKADGYRCVAVKVVPA